MFRRLIRILQRERLSYLIVDCIAKLLRVNIGMNRAKYKARNILEERYGYTVAHGPFKGMKLSENITWSKNDQITQTLGIYEEHVLSKLIYFSSEGSKRFIDIGAADGYFAVGLAFSKIYQEVYAFEINPKSQQQIKINAARNSCSEKVTVYSEANVASLNKLINKDFKSTFLIDIEGAEYDLLSDEMLLLLKGNYIICELHPWHLDNGNELQKDLLDRASRLYKIELILRESYTPNLFSELDDLSDEERLVAVGEDRGKNMQWLVLTPK